MKRALRSFWLIGLLTMSSGAKPGSSKLLLDGGPAQGLVE
jgi:hypothetical protein